MKQPRERRAVADLHGQMPLRPVQDGLPVKADDIDAVAVDLFPGEEAFDRLGMAP